MVCACQVPSVVSDSATPWTVARQAPLSMGFSRQEYWSGLPFPPPGNLTDPGIEPAHVSYVFLPRQAGSLPLAPPGKPCKVAPNPARLGDSSRQFNKPQAPLNLKKKKKR